MVFRRIRGLLGSMIAGAIPWSLIGAATIFVLRSGLIPGFSGAISSNISDNMYIAGAVFGAVIGAVSGLAFGLLVLASERNRSVLEIRGSRFVAFGVIANGAVFAILFGTPVLTLAASFLGGATSAVTLWMARRALRNELPALEGAESTVLETK